MALWKQALLLAVLVACSSSKNATFPDPLPLTGPFFFVHDPSIVQRADGKYFLFTTHNKAGIITADRLQGLVNFHWHTFSNSNFISTPALGRKWVLFFPTTPPSSFVWGLD